MQERGLIRIIIVLSGALLWVAYLFDVVCSRYAIYEVMDYGAHELLSMLPYVSALATAVWLVITLVKGARRKNLRRELAFCGVLAVLLAVQWGYLIERSHRSTTTVLAQVTETVLVPAQGLQAVIRHPEGYEITLWCPQLAWELLQLGREYLVTYEWDDRMPREGTLCMVHP